MLLSEDKPLGPRRAEMKAARPTQSHFPVEQAFKVFVLVSAVVDLLLLLRVHRHSRLVCKKGRVGWVCVFVYIYTKKYVFKRDNRVS